MGNVYITFTLPRRKRCSHPEYTRLFNKMFKRRGNNTYVYKCPDCGIEVIITLEQALRIFDIRGKLRMVCRTCSRKYN